MSDAEPSAQSETEPHLNVTALFNEAAGKSGLLWIDIPGDRAWPVWHAWANQTVYVVSGPGEQPLPWLPDTVNLILRSKDTGGRLLTVQATASRIPADDDRWGPAVEALRAGRLNAVGDVEQRWRDEATIYALVPFGLPVEQPGRYAEESGAVAVAPAAATTARWRPWHVGGRPQRRRRMR